MDRANRSARGAVFSLDRAYRHLLWRDDVAAVLGVSLDAYRRALFVMCNPSVGDEFENDRTLGRCYSFAARERCESYEVVNTHDLVTPKPKVMHAHPTPVSAENDAFVVDAMRNASIVIAAWGGDKKANQRAPRMRSLAREAGVKTLYCLGTTDSGAPNHPLYLPGATPLVAWAHL